MYLTIHPDGRTFRHDSRPGHDPGGIAYCELSWSRPFGSGRAVTRPVAVPLVEGGLTLWADERTITHAEGLRNVPATLLMPQFGTPARLLAGTVVVTSSGSQASAFVEDARWSHVEGLVEDITRATCGLAPIHGAGMPPAWPQAVRLAAAVLRDMERRPAPGGADPYEFLMRELTIGVTP